MTHEEKLALKADGNCWVDGPGGTFWWPFCIVDGCSNRACLRLNSPRCYPHTLPGVPLANSETKPEKLTAE